MSCLDALSSTDNVETVQGIVCPVDPQDALQCESCQ